MSHQQTIDIASSQQSYITKPETSHQHYDTFLNTTYDKLHDILTVHITIYQCCVKC